MAVADLPKRPSKDAVGMAVAMAWASRTTCLRRAVGCLLVDEYGRTLSTGHNGVPAGKAHCNEVMLHHTKTSKGPVPYTPYACPGARAESGTNLDGCHAIHAEQNALMFCPDVTKIHTAYVTTSPCIQCVKMLLNTGCQRIVFSEEYPHSESKALWESAGREWCHYEEPQK